MLGGDEGQSGGENKSLGDGELGRKHEAEGDEVPAAEPRAENAGAARVSLSCPLSPRPPFRQLRGAPVSKLRHPASS